LLVLHNYKKKGQLHQIVYNKEKWDVVFPIASSVLTRVPNVCVCVQPARRKVNQALGGMIFRSVLDHRYRTKASRRLIPGLAFS
jgi:hypothetical protein